MWHASTSRDHRYIVTSVVSRFSHPEQRDVFLGGPMAAWLHSYATLVKPWRCTMPTNTYTNQSFHAK
jgi:hypothetical protein